MRVSGVHSTYYQPLHSLLPMQRKPQYGFVDFLGELSAGAPVLDGNGNTITDDTYVEYDSVRGCVTARSMFVPHNNVMSGQGYGQCANSFPTVTWQALTSTPGSGCTGPGNTEQSFLIEEGEPFNHCCVNFMNYYVQDVDPPMNEVTGYAVFPTLTQGFTFLLGLHPDTLTDFQSNFAIRFHTTDQSGADGRWYSISFQVGWGLLYGYNDVASVGLGQPNDTPGNWKWFDSVKTGSAYNKLMTGAQVTMTACVNSVGLQTNTDWANIYVVTVRLMAGQVSAAIGNETTPYLYPQTRLSNSGYPYAFIDSVNIRGYGNHCGMFSVHPTKWLHGAYVVSAEQNIGFVPETQQLNASTYTVQYMPNQSTAPTNPDQVGYVPTGYACTASFDQINGTELQYLLSFGGTQSGTFHVDDFGNPIPYQDLTAAVRAVSGFIPGVPYQTAGEPTHIMPEVIEVEHTFDFNTLSISSTCALTMNNYTAQWSAAMQNYLTPGFVDANGHVGLTIQLGIAGFAGPYTQFTGFWNTDFEDHMQPGGQSRVTIRGQDCWISLDVPVFNLPWMDGWNVVYALYYLAQQGGIPLSRMNFQGMVNTTNPYASNADGSQSFYLPVGPAGSPLTRFGNGAKIKDIMKKLSIFIGNLLFFDAFANLTFTPFSIPQIVTAPYPYIFSYVGQTSVTGLNNEIWGGEYVGTLREVRNRITVIGVSALGPEWLPIVAHAVDEESIWNINQSNFKGFADPLIWADSQFANESFAQAAANAMLVFLDAPKREVSLTTWIQANYPIYPLNIIQIVDPKSGAGNSALYFLVVRVKHHLQKGVPPTTELSGRWIPQIQGANI
jgi:hypothetical protein